jgi:hypothetical protein
LQRTRQGRPRKIRGHRRSRFQYARNVFGFVFIGVLVIAVLLVVVSQSRWAGNKGCAYNKHNPRPRGVGMPKIVDEIYQPSVEHVI